MNTASPSLVKRIITLCTEETGSGITLQQHQYSGYTGDKLEIINRVSGDLARFIDSLRENLGKMSDNAAVAIERGASIEEYTNDLLDKLNAVSKIMKGKSIPSENSGNFPSEK